MEKDLVQLFEAVKKAADAAAADIKSTSSPEEDRCLDALKRLKKFPVTYQILVSTQVIYIFQFLCLCFGVFSHLLVGGCSLIFN